MAFMNQVEDLRLVSPSTMSCTTTRHQRRRQRRWARCFSGYHANKIESRPMLAYLQVLLVVVLLFFQFTFSTAVVVVRADGDGESGGDDYGGIVWQDLSVTTPTGPVLLHSCSGRVPSGQLCGILGPSGSGKSTFLSALAGLFNQQQGRSVMQGEIYSYQYHEDDDSGDAEKRKSNSSGSSSTRMMYYQRIPSSEVAWLQQHDDFFSMLTVYETVQLAAFLELPNLPAHQRAVLVQDQLDQLGLTKVANRPVGEASTSSSAVFASSSGRISGGERRRLAVALELISGEKQLFLADEATSGLDSSMSHKVVQLIQSVAQTKQIPAFCSLHQPRSSIWRLLDHVILLCAGGHVCYSGPRRDCLPYFASIGYPCPEETNPAEYLIDLVSLVETTEDQQRVDDIIQKFAVYQSHRQSEIRSDNAVVMRDGHKSLSKNNVEGEDEAMSTCTWTSCFKGPIRILRRFGALLRRSWRQNIRNYPIHVVRLVASALNAVLLASIFPSVAPGKPPTASSVADRVALLSFGAINMCFLAFMKTITLLAEERPVIDRERTRSQYSSLEYLTAKVLADLPMDSFFAGIFTTVLKRVSGLAISWGKVTATFSLLTTAGASLGLALGCWSPDAQMSKTASVPVLVLLMVVGVINPSGVDQTKNPPFIIQKLKLLSPFAFAIEALCLGEYPGMEFSSSSKGWFSRIRDFPRMGGLALVKNGDQVIEALGLTQQTYANALRHMAVLSGIYLLASYVGLAAQHWIPKLQRAASKRTVRRRDESSVGSGKAPSKSNSNFKAPVRLSMQM